MVRRSVTALVLLGLLLIQRPVLAEGPLDAVSTDATAVIRIKAPKATTEKMAAFASAVNSDWGDMVKASADKIGVGIKNQNLEGVDRSADWYIAVFAQDEGPPTTLFVIPATNVEMMEKAVGEDMHFTKSGKYGVYTEDEDLFEEVTKHLKSKGKSISTEMDEAAAALFNKGEIGVYVDVAGLVEDHADELDEGLKNMPIPPNAAPGVDPEAVEKLVKAMAAAMLQGLKDTESFSLSLGVSKTGISIEELLKVEEDSAFDKLLQKSPPSTIALLGNLPKDAQAYMGVKIDMSGMMALSKDMMALSPELKKALETSLADLSKVKFGASAVSFSLKPTETGAIETVSITEATPTAKIRDANKKMAVPGGITTTGVKQTTTVKTDAEKYGSRSADLVTITYEPTEDADETVSGMIKTMTQTLFGEEGITTRNVYLEDRVVQTLGGGKAAMTKVLGSMDKPATSKAFDSTRALLGAKSNVVVLFDLPSTLLQGIRVAVNSNLPLPIPAEKLDDVKITSNYLGFSGATEPGGVRLITVIPVEQIKGVWNLFEALNSKSE